MWVTSEDIRQDENMKALQTKLDHSLSSETEEQDTAYSL
jgi:hypothetical protein